METYNQNMIPKKNIGKKTYEFSLVLFLIMNIGFNQLAFSQSNEEGNTDEEPLIVMEDSTLIHLDNAFYLKFGAGPKSHFSGLPNFPLPTNFPDLEAFANDFDYEVGATDWFSMEIGSHFYYTSSKKKFRLGTDVTYVNVNYIPLNLAGLRSANPENFTHQEDPIILVGPEIGPVLSLNPATVFVFDFSYQISPTFGHPPGAEITYTTGPIGVQQKLLLEDEKKFSYVGLKHSLNLNVRIPVLMLSASAILGDFNFGNMTYESTVAFPSSTETENVSINKSIEIIGFVFYAGLNF